MRPAWNGSKGRATKRSGIQGFQAEQKRIGRPHLSAFECSEAGVPGHLDCGWSAYRLRRSGYSPAIRSEEHTSELQSLMRISYAVFCLKKKKTQILTEPYSN